MAEITKDLLITDEALQVPQQLADGFDKAVAAVESLLAISKKYEDQIGGSDTIPKLKKDTDGFGESLTELDKIQKAYTQSTQKLSDEYISYKKAVNDVNQAVKDKTALGDREATSINAQNASLKQLDAALQKNRQTYKDLVGDQQRNSASGQELLRVIQQQDAASKALSATIGQQQKNVGDYVNALKMVSPVFSQAASAATNFGSSVKEVFDALLKNPIIAIGATILATFEALREITKLYFSETIDGVQKATEIDKVWETSIATIKSRWAEAGEGIANVWHDMSIGAAFYFTSIILGEAEAAKALKAGLDIAKLENELRDEELQNIVRNSRLQLDKDKEMFDARDKLRKSDQQRDDALRQSMIDAAQIRENEIASVNKQIEANRILMNTTKEKFPLLEIEANLQARLNQIEDEKFQGARRRQALEVQIIDDSIKRTEEAQKIIRDANTETNETVIQSDINANNTIIGNQQFALDTQLGALGGNLILQKQANDLARDKEIQSAKEAARKRVVVDGEVMTAILEDTTHTLAWKDQAIINAQNREVDNDLAFQTLKNSINTKYAEKFAQDTKASAAKVAGIIDDSFKYQISLREKFNQEDTNKAIAGLNEKYEKGKLTIAQYNGAMAAIMREGNLQTLHIQEDEEAQEIKALQDKQAAEVGLTKEEYKLLEDLQKKHNETIAKQAKLTADQKLEIDKNVHKAQLQLETSAAGAIMAIGNNLYAEQFQQEQNKLNNLQTQKDKELAVAGLTADQKAAIDKKYTTLTTIENEKVLELKRKQAVFDKEVAAFQIIIKTAQGVGDALGNVLTIPLIPFILAEGALEEAVVLSKPIPSYQFGTKSHIGGTAVVGEVGTELVKEPGGNMFLTPALPTIMDIAKGSEVFTNTETMKILALGSLNAETHLIAENSLLQNEIKVLGGRIEKSNARLEKAISKIDGALIRHGSLLYQTKEDANGNKRLIRLKSFTQ